VLELSGQMPAPRLAVRDDGGRVLFDQTVLLNTGLAGTYLARLTVPETGRSFVVGARRDEEGRRWLLVLFPSRDTPGASAGRLTLAPDEEGSLDGFHFRFAGLSAMPAAARGDIPVPPGVAQEAAVPGPLLVQMRNAVYGSSQASSGLAVASPAIDGPPTLAISGLGAETLALAPGESVTVGGYQYTFAGQRPFAGIQVKRDRGAPFIWIGVGLLVAGLVITFHVPRRRLWARMTGERTYIAGIAGPLVDLGGELHHLGAEAGAPDALPRDETDE